MKKLLTLTLLVLCVCNAAALAQTSTSATASKIGTKQGSKRGPIFRATKEQINQAQAILKDRGFYAGEQIGKLDDATREGLRKYQQAEGLKVTGTLNRITLEKMNIGLTDKQKTM
jgi:peptidoglycan hydrolase-like protein with peptidoglycan-binding domain